MIDVFAGRQRRDRSIGKEVKVEPKSQGIAWMPEAVRQKMKGTIHKHIIKHKYPRWKLRGIWYV